MDAQTDERRGAADHDHTDRRRGETVGVDRQLHQGAVDPIAEHDDAHLSRLPR
jgi:hypothetical protein